MERPGLTICTALLWLSALLLYKPTVGYICHRPYMVFVVMNREFNTSQRQA